MLFYLGQRSSGETLRAEAGPPVNAISAAASATITTRSSTSSGVGLSSPFTSPFLWWGGGERSSPLPRLLSALLSRAIAERQRIGQVAFLELVPTQSM